jgi:hypothetical protein
MNNRQLTRIIRNIEQSLDSQELSLSPKEKASLIVDLYEQANREGRIPNKMTTDRLVWLA